MKPIDMLEMQKIEFEILKEFDRVCRKHGIRYSLAYGTLLGALRHQGFIPWDDDIDIMMPREDYNRLIQVAKQELKTEFELCDYDHTPGYYHRIPKIIHRNTLLIENVNVQKGKELGVYIDIFPLDKIPEKKYQWNHFYHWCTLEYRKYTFALLRYKATGNRMKDFIKRWMYRYYHHQGPKRYLSRFDKQIAYASTFDSCTIKDITIPEKKETQLRLSDFNDLILLPFENEMFYCIRNYDPFLKAKYGDYHKLPPLHERVSNHDVKVFWKSSY